MFDRLWISSSDSIIKLDTIKILPLASADSSFRSNLMINEIAFTGIDFKKAYEENKIGIHKLEINNPDFSLIQKSISAASNMNINLGQLPFKEVSLDMIHLNNGKLSLDVNRKITSEDVYVKIMNYRIDSSTIFLEDLTNSLKDFNFNATNTTIELPDSIHELKIGNLAVNAEDSLALINNIQVNPIASRRYYNLYQQQGLK